MAIGLLLCAKWEVEMPWIQVIILLLQILKEIWKDKNKSAEALLEAGFTEQDDGIWCKYITKYRRSRSRGKDVSALLMYSNGRFSTVCNGDVQEFDTFDDFKKHLLQLRKG